MESSLLLPGSDHGPRGGIHLYEEDYPSNNSHCQNGIPPSLDLEMCSSTAPSDPGTQGFMLLLPRQEDEDRGGELAWKWQTST